MSKNSESVPLLNGLRGIAVLGVVWQHLFWVFNIPGQHPIAMGPLLLAGNPFASNGWMGVNLFFFCSGFVLFLPYCNGRRSFSSHADTVWFWKHRAARLWPLFYLSLFLGIGVSVTAEELTHPSVIASVFMAMTGLFVLLPYTFMPIGNGVLWSLGVEALFSAIFPLLERGIRRYGMAHILVAAIVLGLACRTLGYYWFREPGLYLNFLSDGVLGRMDDFVWGMACARLFADGRLPRNPAIVWLGCAMLLSSAVISDMWFALWTPSWVQAANFTLFNSGTFLLVSGLLTGGGWLRRIIEFRLLQVIGMMCFSIYVWHSILYIEMFTRPERFSIADMRHGLPGYLLVLVAVSCLSYRFIEFPGKSFRELFLLEGSGKELIGGPKSPS
ncbi:MAG: acyltransferase [Steroidobacteraceae bacterium]